jgi:DNA-binding IclR family transcriptional regulator
MTGKVKVEGASAGPRAIVRALRLFEALATEPEGLPLSDLGARLKEPKSTLLNSLRALEAEGFLHANGLSYQLGPRAFRLATQITSGWSLLRAMRGHLRALADRAGETSLLGVLDPTSHRVVYIDAIESVRRIRYALGAGSSGPLYATASGRVLLAFQPQAYQDAYIDELVFEPLTAVTNLDKDVLRQQLIEVRRARLWVSAGEIYADGGAIAAPVFGPAGGVIAALSIAMPLTRLEARREELTAIVADVAAQASGLSMAEPLHLDEK